VRSVDCSFHGFRIESPFPMNRHLHPALVHSLLALFSLGCFALVAWSVVSGQPITVFDADQAKRFYNFASSRPAVWDAARWVTDLGSGRPRIIVIAGVALILLSERRWRLTIFWAATQWLVPEIVASAKGTFERPRPQFAGSPYVLTDWSFPSGHATGAMATYAMIAYLVAWRWADRWFLWPAVLGAGAIILLVGLSRMLLGVHYFTDILGGYFLGLGYLSLCVAAIEWGKRRGWRG
jgi:membrane-associated phospholipid phosphatase